MAEENIGGIKIKRCKSKNETTKILAQDRK